MNPFVFDKTIGVGPTTLVTAGVDGDEYAGIEAAFQLITKYEKTPFIGRLIIVPIVNTAGFIHETSFNPEDWKYPKHMGIGKKNGSSSQKLMYWLTTTYGIHADVWMDLHGGSLTEVLTPFVAHWKTGKKEIDGRGRVIVSYLSVEHVLYETAKLFGSARYLAQHGCTYILTESGERGERNPKAIDAHIEWVKVAMATTGMIKHSSRSRTHIPYEHLAEYQAPAGGMWYPAFDRPRTFKRGETLGIVKTVNGKQSIALKAKQNSMMLWGKVTARAQKGEILIGVGF